MRAIGHSAFDCIPRVGSAAARGVRSIDFGQAARRDPEPEEDMQFHPSVDDLNRMAPQETAM